MALTNVYLIRHGERIHIPNSKGIGLIDGGPGLSKLGIKQAEELAKKFYKIRKNIDGIYSSDMTRAIETAKIISKKLNKKLKIVKGISEFNQILWQNRLYHYKYWKHYLKHKKSIYTFNKILKDNPSKNIIIVSHGNVIKGILSNKLGIKKSKMNKLDYENCHVSLMHFNGKNLEKLSYFNSKELH